MGSYRKKHEVERDIERQAKECKTCSKIVPFSGFAKCAGSKDGVTSRCRACESEAYMESTKDITRTRRHRTHAQVAEDIKRQAKECSRCLKIVPFSNYRANGMQGRSKDNLTSICKACDQAEYLIEENRTKARKTALRNKYGITDAKFKAMLATQGGGCAICGNDHNVTSKLGHAVKLHVDHCHETGKIRGILCNRCNSGLGHFDDNLEGLMQAVRYLEGAE